MSIEKCILFTVDGTPIYLNKRKYDLAKKYKWHIQRYKNGTPMLVTYFNGKTYYFTHLVFGLQKGEKLYRKDSSIFDFTRENLMMYTRCGKDRRYGKNIRNTSGYNYVYKVKDKWSVCIRIKGTLIYRGKYSDKDEAGIVADYWSLKYAGVCAYLNFPNKHRRTLYREYKRIIEKYGYEFEEKDLNFAKLS